MVCPSGPAGVTGVATQGVGACRSSWTRTKTAARRSKQAGDFWAEAERTLKSHVAAEMGDLPADALCSLAKSASDDIAHELCLLAARKR